MNADEMTEPNRRGALPWLRADGRRLVDEDGNEVILRGVATIDIGSQEQLDGGVIPLIDRLTDKTDTAGNSIGWHPTVIRFPVYPVDSDVLSPIRYTPGSTEYYDTLLRPLVDYATARGLYVIIDWHYIDTTTAHVESTAQFWRDMAPRFADDSNVLYELYNEPINDGDWAGELKGHMQSWYNIVREAAPRNVVLVGTPNWCQNVGLAALDPIDGTNVMYAAHMYPMHWALPHLVEEIETACRHQAVFMSEWGYEEGADEVVDGTVTSYGAPFKAFVTKLGVSWVAWVAHYKWFPAIFIDDQWQLSDGPGRMGVFTKDWLYEERNRHRPGEK
ncbi:MAG: cellulase family glycosylhydrolase [Deltaproteobacteria bacterium]|nr:cellulase family glycosylhydrolase [Deltaproteobacteria bacterium]MBN2671151.1 cellulase family glycosylhydrolase [Deltaproteobacteria bacterium]